MKPHLHKSVLQAEIDICKSEGITVEEWSMRQVESHINKCKSSSSYDGSHDTQNGFQIQGLYFPFNRLIVLRQDFPNYLKFTTLLHEKGHDICDTSKCKCVYNRILTEIHACKYVLSILLERELWNLLKINMEQDKLPKQAMRAIKKSVLWERCVKAISYKRQIVSEWIFSRRGER